MKNFISQFGLFFFLVLFCAFPACKIGTENHTKEPSKPLNIGLIDLEDLEVGNFLEEWDRTGPLQLNTLDLSKFKAFQITDSLGSFWAKKVAIAQPIVASNAVNDTMLRQPNIKELKVNMLLIKVFDPKTHNPVIKRFANVSIKNVYIHQLTMSKKPGAIVFDDQYQTTLAAAQKAQSKVKSAEKLRSGKVKESPLHAAKMLEPNLVKLDSAVSAILLYLKAYKPNGGPIDLNVFNLQIEAINKQTTDIVNAITNPASEVQELKVVFASASYDIDDYRNGAVLNSYLNDVLAELNRANVDTKKPVSIKVIIAAFADLQNINDLGLKKNLSERFKIACEGDQECLNMLLSKARAEAVKEWFEKAIYQKKGPGTKVDVVIEATGEGWEVPKTYQGNCPNKNCEDRRVALISSVVF